MLRTALLTTAAAAALLAAAPASAAPPRVAKFEASFEAKRVVEWGHPRGVNLVDCKGEHFHEEKGSETWEMRTARPQRLLVQGGLRGTTVWRFGTWDARSVTPDEGLVVKGPRTRDWSVSRGTSGGFCKWGYNVDPQPQNDCGTRLPEHVVRFHGQSGVVFWNHAQASWTRRESFGFERCLLMTPDGVPDHDFPTVTKKVAPAAFFDRTRKRIVIAGSESFGPTVEGVANLGVERTMTADVSWKLTLVRKR